MGGPVGFGLSWEIIFFLLYAATQQQAFNLDKNPSVPQEYGEERSFWDTILDYFTKGDSGKRRRRDDDDVDDDDEDAVPLLTGSVLDSMVGDYRRVWPASVAPRNYVRHPFDPTIAIACDDTSLLYTRVLLSDDYDYAGHSKNFMTDMNAGLTIRETEVFMIEAEGAVVISDDHFSSGGNVEMSIIYSPHSLSLGDMAYVNQNSPSAVTYGEVFWTAQRWFRPVVDTTYQTDKQIVPFHAVVVKQMIFHYEDESGINEYPVDGRLYLFWRVNGSISGVHKLSGSLRVWHTPLPWDTTDGGIP